MEQLVYLAISDRNGRPAILERKVVGGLPNLWQESTRKQQSFILSFFRTYPNLFTGPILGNYWVWFVGEFRYLPITQALKAAAEKKLPLKNELYYVAPDSEFFGRIMYTYPYKAKGRRARRGGQGSRRRQTVRRMYDEYLSGRLNVEKYSNRSYYDFISYLQKRVSQVEFYGFAGTQRQEQLDEIYEYLYG